MEALLASTFTVAIAEIGDKTQLLALLLAARFKNKTAIIMGILLLGKDRPLFARLSTVMARKKVAA